MNSGVSFTTQNMVKKHQNMRLYGVRNLGIRCEPIKDETLLSKKATTQCLMLKHSEYKTMKYETTKSAVYPLVNSLGKVHGLMSHSLDWETYI